MARQSQRISFATYPEMATHLDRFLETAPVRSEDLAAFVAEVTANLRPTNQVTPVPDGAVPTELAAGTPAREAAPPSLPPLPRHRLGLWMGGGLLAAGLLGAGGALVWSGARHASAPRADAGRPVRLDRAAAPVDAHAPSSPDRTGAVSELRSRPAPRRHRLDRPVAKTGTARPDAAAPAPSAAAESPRVRRQRLQVGIEALTQQARGRGLFPGDDDEADRAALQGRRGLQAGALDEADAAVARLRARVQMFRIDRSFAERKLRRLERAIAAASGRLPEADRQRLGTVSQNILRLIMEGRLVEASAQMSRTLGEL